MRFLTVRVFTFFKLFCGIMLLFCEVCWVSAQEKQVIKESLGKITHPELSELSGMVMSLSHKDCFWVHNDSGDEARIYLVDSTATLLCTFQLEGIEAIDFEEIAWLYINNEYYLLVGDIGDNQARRKDILFYLFKEPVWDSLSNHIVIPNHHIKTFTVNYPDRPRDAEAFFVDPLDHRLYLISKRDFHVNLYETNMLNEQHKLSHKFDKIAKLPLFFVTGADISHDGRFVLVKNLTNIYFWERRVGESIVKTLTSNYHKMSYFPEPQGESICFDLSNSSYYTISERPLGLDSYIYRYLFK